MASSRLQSWLSRTFPPLTAESESMLHLDVLRFLASAGIVVFHFNRFINIDGRWGPIDNTIKAFSLLVDLFFVLSGYIIIALYRDRMASLADFGDFLRRRIARLVPLHWATLLVFVLIWQADAAGLLQDHDPRRYDPNCLVPNLLLVQAWGTCHYLTFNFVSWSISAEFGLYLAFPLLLRLVRRGPSALLVASGATLALLMLVSLGPGAPRDFHQWTFDFGVLRALPGFLIGMTGFALRARLGRIPHPRRWLLGLGLAFLAGAAIRLDRTILLLVVYGFALAAIAADQAGRTSPLVRKLAPLGQLTYSLYMLHPIVLKAALAHWGLGILNLGGDAMRLWALLWGLILLPLSYFSLVGFERPARRWITTLGRDRRARAPDAGQS